jgi:hypothetical protein
MNDDLLIADPAPKLDLLKRLSIDADIAEAATSPRFLHDIEIQPLHVQSGKFYGILSLPCGLQGQAFLYLLDNSGADNWHAVDHVAMDCFHATPTSQLLSLAPGEDAVFVQHANSGHGSGIVEDKAVLYTVRNGQMHQILSTLDYILRWGLSDSSPPVEQKSSFLLFPNRVIEETRITSENDSPIRVERRVWRWSTKQEAFSATPFHLVPEQSIPRQLPKPPR